MVLRYRRVLLGHAALNFDGTAYRIDGAGKLDQHAVAGGLDDAAAMLGDSGVNEGLSDRLEPSQRAFLVGPHETAIPGDIRRQHRRQSPFYALAGHDAPLFTPSKHGDWASASVAKATRGRVEMSVPGQTRKSALVTAMSAFPR